MVFCISVPGTRLVTNPVPGTRLAVPDTRLVANPAPCTSLATNPYVRHWFSYFSFASQSPTDHTLAVSIPSPFLGLAYIIERNTSVKQNVYLPLCSLPQGIDRKEHVMQLFV